MAGTFIAFALGAFQPGHVGKILPSPGESHGQRPRRRPRRGIQVSAYDFGAVDYLVKPVDPDRFEVAVTRILRALGSETPSAAAGSEPPITAPATFVIPLREGGAKTVIRCDDILWIEGMGNYSRVCVAGDGKPMLVRRSLAHWEKDLPEKDFARLGRSQLIRPERLVLVTWQSRSETLLTFTGSSETLTIGRASAARLREITDATPTE